MACRIDVDRLDRELACRGLSAEDLAVAAGVSPATVSAARHGRRISAPTLRKLALALSRAPVIPGVADLLAGVATDPR